MRAQRPIARSGLTASVLGLALASACGSTEPTPQVRNLDRPASVAFACYGPLKVGDAATSSSAQPLASCAARARGEVPEGQEGVGSPGVFAFALESARGTLALINADPAVGAVIDSDPLTPGRNSIPIGTLPVDVVADGSGCHIVTANAGSCDLSEIAIGAAVDTSEPTEVVHVPVTTPGGAQVLARPAAMVAAAQTTEIGEACPATATGLVYVAYPACNLVAAIDAATGVVRGGVAFGDDGGATVTDGEVACEVECGDEALIARRGGDPEPDAGPDPDGGPSFDGAARPIALALGPDGRLYVGAENQARLAVATLDADGLPIAVASVALDGDVGVRRIAVSEQIAIGGSDDAPPSAATARYAYVVASDATIRVVDLEREVECDAQVDPRYLHAETDRERLACLPVGGVDTPPRRAGRASPGIRLPGAALPLDVAFATVAADVGGQGIGAGILVGTFAFVAGSDGRLYVVNVDDDRYADAEVADNPLAVALPLAMPHQLRDAGTARDAVHAAGACDLAPPEGGGGPRLIDTPVTTVSADQIAASKTGLLPSLRGVACDADEGGSTAVPELSYAAPEDVREASFPDLATVPSERWLVSWEGPLSIDGNDVEVDGPQVRRGLLDGARLADPSGSLCETGVEPYDIAILVGCDPEFGAAQCGVDETCYVHPDAPSVVTTGQCLPTAEVDALSGSCRDFLIGERRYSVRETSAGALTLMPRRRVLRTSPLDGCTSDAQCVEMAAIDDALRQDEHPIAIAPGDEVYAWECGADPSRAAGVPRCMMTCESSEQCEPGTLCDDGYCVEGALPPGRCVPTVQRYLLRVGDAFSVLGDRTGFLHRNVRDPDTDACVADPDASRLQVSRLPLRPPPCTDAPDGPNPCATSVSQTDLHATYVADGDECIAGEAVVRTREVPAVRLENSALTMHLVDLETQGDAVCIGDGEGDAPAFSTVYPGLAYSFEVTSGTATLTIRLTDPQQMPSPSLPVRLAAAPDGLVWIVDAGDAAGGYGGRIYRFDPDVSGLPAASPIF